ncbi:MAG: type II toxin-antitoxin system VapC family toxin [Candidatus Azobacteroides sp.]|nr:type II toxin-antitoxin system VapC family toxin [Candidatus Azobacteroides sp.]
MRYLIDTNVFIRIIKDYDISDNIKDILEDYENMIYVSSESIKEFVHLVQNEKIRLSKGQILSDIFNLIEDKLDFEIKYVTKEHLLTLAKLELVENHNDPSDRLIISQAITERISLISSDAKFPKYRKQGLDLIINRW